jgi:hypothetical protein
MSVRLLVVCFLIVLSLAGLAPSLAGAQDHASLSDPPQKDLTYILPWWGSFRGADAAQINAQVAELRSRIGEGRYVRVGFSFDIWLSMTQWDVDPDDRAAVRLALAATIADLDAAIAKARGAGIPVRIGIFTALRSAVDPAQVASQLEDRRNMQWYSDNRLAAGWWSHSRYARKQSRLQEAYVREMARVLANRIRLYPETIVALAGDGEVELSFDGAPAGSDPVLADYSPFAIAEFRDWLRHDGLYAPGQPFDGEGYQLGTRYRGDASPASDTNGDGHTLNGDFSTSFTTWDLRSFNWSLTDDVAADANAIPATTYLDPLWDPSPAGNATGFDAPRYRTPANAWLNVWHLFRQTMVWRHNLRFAKWMTTSADDETGATIPTDRWFSYQIPADTLFGLEPPNAHPRFETSASAWWTADVAPYGSLGVTSFNLIYQNTNVPGTSYGVRTLPVLAPKIASRKVRWAIQEWHPCLNPDPTYVPPDTANVLNICRADMDLIVQYRPALLVPFAWKLPDSPVEDTSFEIALRELVARLNAGYTSNAVVAFNAPAEGATLAAPFTVTGWAADFGNAGAGRSTGISAVHLYAHPEGSGAPVFLGLAQYGISRPDVAALFGSQFESSGFSLQVTDLPPGRYRIAAYAEAAVDDTFAASASVNITVTAPPPPPGPGDDLVVSFGTAGVWMLADGVPGNWWRLHTAVARHVVTADLDGGGLSDVIIDFGAAGIWVWANNAEWSRLHAASATRIVPGDLDGNGQADLLFDFPGAGIWVWSNNTSWFKLHSSNANNIVTADLDGNGKQEAIIDFPGYGLWVWDQESSWSWLHHTNSRLMTAGDFDGDGHADLVVDFAGYGLWRYSDGEWSQVHESNAVHLAAGDVDGSGGSDLLVDFGSPYGIWMLANGTTWSPLHQSTSVNIVTGDLDGNGQGDVIIDFGAAGLWEYANNTGWIRLHSVPASGIAVGDINAP